jgi:hypothetical protein
MRAKKLARPPFTVRKVTENHWSLVYMDGPAISERGEIYRFLTESEAREAAITLNAREARRRDPPRQP